MAVLPDIAVANQPVNQTWIFSGQSIKKYSTDPL